MARNEWIIKRWGISDDTFDADRSRSDYPLGLVLETLEAVDGKPYGAASYVWVYRVENCEKLERDWEIEDAKTAAGNFQIKISDMRTAASVAEFFDPTPIDVTLGYPAWKKVLPPKAESLSEAMSFLLKIGFLTREDLDDLAMLKAKLGGFIASIKRGNSRELMDFEFDKEQMRVFADNLDNVR
ncbi:MAG: hypothetical protein COY80_02680 [Candidatus Pacebacteria bacterium CG_4_10_14_0_8_um_filter_42_14]|nr:MAG: hypothetical protein COY80_02680 [Candidatus Pacebacteria bacterium CG_4_10_14_0_8_um_filter_42_14]